MNTKLSLCIHWNYRMMLLGERELFCCVLLFFFLLISVGSKQSCDSVVFAMCVFCISDYSWKWASVFWWEWSLTTEMGGGKIGRGVGTRERGRASISHILLLHGTVLAEHVCLLGEVCVFVHVFNFRQYWCKWITFQEQEWKVCQLGQLCTFICT